MTIEATISGVSQLITLPEGSRIIETSGGCKLLLYNQASNTEIEVSDDIDTLFNQLTNSIKITDLNGKKCVYVLTPYTKITKRGSGSRLSFKDGVRNQIIDCVESVATLKAQAQSGSGGTDVYQKEVTINAEILGLGYYQDANLAGKTNLTVLLDGSAISRDTDYTYTSGTGRITPVNGFVEGQELNIIAT